jgi:hypothetical protein
MYCTTRRSLPISTCFTPKQRLAEKFLAERNTPRAESLELDSSLSCGLTAWPASAAPACPLIEEGAAAVLSPVGLSARG